MTDDTLPPTPGGEAAHPEAGTARNTPKATAEQRSPAAATVRTRRAFLGLGAAGVAGLLGGHYLLSSPPEQGLPRGLRRVLDFNARLTQGYYRNTRLAPEFARSQARPLRLNEAIGLEPDFDPAAWKMRVRGYAPAGTPARQQEFTMAAIKALPRTEMTTEFKCIEGWNTIVHWAGVRFSDFLARYPLATADGHPIADLRQPPPPGAAQYVGFSTPNEQYYVGIELYAALHPQTLLAYELNGVPLTPAHGAPLRLVTPLKYGVKQLKCIGNIFFADARPADYWAEQGYDWSGEH